MKRDAWPFPSVTRLSGTACSSRSSRVLHPGHCSGPRMSSLSSLLPFVESFISSDQILLALPSVHCKANGSVYFPCMVFLFMFIYSVDIPELLLCTLVGAGVPSQPAPSPGERSPFSSEEKAQYHAGERLVGEAPEMRLRRVSLGSQSQSVTPGKASQRRCCLA